MKLVIKNNQLIATHDNNQEIQSIYPDSEIIWVPNSVKLEILDNISDPDSLNPLDLPKDPRLKWNLEQNRKNALLVIEDIAEEYRLKILSNMPGRIAGYEAKAIIARRILGTESPDVKDLEYLQLEADQRNIQVIELAQTITQKSEEFAKASATIDGEIKVIKVAINSSKKSENIWKSLKDFELKIKKLSSIK